MSVISIGTKLNFFNGGKIDKNDYLYLFIEIIYP